MGELFKLLKDGNKPSLLAAIVNTIIALLKGGAFFFTGNVAMFAEMMHSIGDAANQFFVYIGSSLSKKAPTPRFPNGFGRLVNLVCLGAVIIVGILSYETIIEGWHHIQHPTESTGVAITLSVLAIAIVLEFVVLYKAGKEILHEVGVKGTLLSPLTTSFANLSRAKPATKLVFMEDLVATSGGILAFVAVLISHFTGFLQAEGIASIMIGIMMFYVVGKVFLDNARGALGETDEQMLVHIAHIVSENEHVKDIQKLEVIKEGEYLHVEIIIEIDPKYTFAEVDDISDTIKELILTQQGVTDITISFDEDDGIRTWTQHKDERTVLKTRD
ncbi:cation diffusion facilitator family transporter [Paenisporosarcina quisquiliarum]|uniref:cation diffusion facilitator family transporter n=1 Tax=Psychrobacillus TaxID=1221880 RepID=UPI0008CEACCB|nr:cation diffusion facilitator family transporter [Psychrobacillus psychrodurans]MCK1998632.1 cation diffusion facilitator family transporter [Psychrobacillus psychrodurans]MCZ8540431.1 cation diffusion facilitator family transporter [Psychrobacillus psychrodurans]SEN22680.1 cation diffusion facilitator family transporter [Paenisporosarcina quisquiliarum]SFM58360.1 cation diffusion facilitator family transporter [Psychrobacillus psychrodurans]